MNRLANWVMRLYPTAWRARYGDEMDALLADSGADAKTIADLLTGGMRMRFSKGSFLMLALGLGVAGMLLGLGASYLFKPEYRSTATMKMTAVQMSGQIVQRDPTPPLNQIIQREVQNVMSRTALASIIQDPRLDLYSDERKNTPLEDVIDEMKRNIRIEYMALPGNLGPRVTAFNILFDYPDRLKAQRTVFALMNAFMYQNQETQAGEQDRLQGEGLEVIDAASLPVQPILPNRPNFALFGGLLGFLLACGIAVIRGARHSSSTAMLATNE
jgi:hypothetical protein